MLSGISALNLIGFTSSAIAAGIYEFVHRANTIQERCILHLSLTLALTEYLTFLNFISFDEDDNYAQLKLIIVISMRIYVIALSSFLWSLILAFHLWTTFRPRTDENSTDSTGSTSNNSESSASRSTSNSSESVANDSQLMKLYFLICYGIPFLFYLTINLGGLVADDLLACMKIIGMIVVLSIIFSGVLYIDLSYQINELLFSHRNDEVELNMKQIKYRQQFANKVFLSLVLPWMILSISMLALFIDNLNLQNFLLKLPFYVIGIQGLCLYFIMVIFRKRIWKDLEARFGLQKPTVLINFEKSCGNISEDDDEEEVMNNQTSLDFLAAFYRMRRVPNRQTNPPHNSSEYLSLP